MMSEESMSEGRVDVAESVAPRRTRAQWCFLVFKVIASTVVGVALVLIILLSLYMFSRRNHGHGYRAEAIMNAGQIRAALFQFENEYGSYPNESTIPEVLAIAPEMKNHLGTKSSNDFMRQLVVAGFMDLERAFGAKGVNPKAPDNRVNGSQLLEPGECVFSYVVWDDTDQMPSNAPILILPLIKGEKRFDRGTKIGRGHKTALILHRDTSVRVYAIDESGRVTIDGKDFFDPSQPYWGGQKPRIAWPE